MGVGATRRVGPWRGPRWRARRGSRGQAIVEFALVAPLLFMLIFGVIEFSLISASIGSYNFAAKDAARLGSLLGRTDATVDQQMVSAIRGRVLGVVMARPQRIEIYKADASGTPVMSGGVVVENVYDINATPLSAPLWPPSLRNDSLLNADFLGVRISFSYTYLTSYISGVGTNLQLTANSVQRIEPQDYQSYRGRPALAQHGGGGTSPVGWPTGAEAALAALVVWRGARVRGGLS